MVGDVLQPLDDERSGDAEGEVPDDVEVWRVCGAARTVTPPEINKARPTAS